jgi:phospho-N-acetylmuramoyl-pentapeptide-transferase
MLYYLSHFSDQFGPLRVFEYVTPRAGGACLTAFLISMLFGNRVILKLTAMKFGQPIRTAEEVHKLHELHQGKGGTPTMGGVLIIASIMGAVLLWAIPTNPFIIALTIVLLGLGFLGFLDDYRKVKKRNTAGVSARGKLLLQLIVTGGAATFLLCHDAETRAYLEPIYAPFLKNPIVGRAVVAKDAEAPVAAATGQTGQTASVPAPAAFGVTPPVMFGIALCFFLLVMVGGSNAVNLTDGLDGLAIGCMMIASMSYAIFAYVTGNAKFAEYLFLPHHSQVSEVTVFCMATVGAGAGFLWFNCHPARVFMGDTGSLSLGGLLGMMAICSRQELLLVVIGGVFVMEAMSVILQVGSFKLTGKRIFRMAPIHHHFELMGWKETKVITRFWILAIMFALAGLATLKIR